MAMDFSGGAGASTPFDLIPVGQVAWAIFTVRGLKASAGGGQYLDCELTIDEGQPFAKRKVFEKVGDPNHAGNSEGYRQMGMVAITRILEAGRGAGPNNPNAYKIDNYQQLNGLRVAIKIGIEKGTGGHDDKNRVSEFLTPNPASQSGHKGFQQLASGVFNAATANQPAAAQAGFSGFGAGQPAASAPATGGFGAAAAQQQPATSGFGSGGTAAATSGFQQASATGQDAASAADQSTQAKNGFAATTTATEASPSNPQATPTWLEQAGQQ